MLTIRLQPAHTVCQPEPQGPVTRSLYGGRKVVTMTAKEIAAITAQVVAAMQAQDEPKDEPKPKAKARTRKASTRKAQVPASCITAEIAWQLLGADENFKPKDGSKPATNAQLWRLNTAGRLSVS